MSNRRFSFRDVIDRHVKENDRAEQCEVVQDAVKAKVSLPTVPKRRLRFEHRYQRITTYLENALADRARDLHRSGEIESLTALFNASLSMYLDKYHPST